MKFSIGPFPLPLDHDQRVAIAGVARRVDVLLDLAGVPVTWVPSVDGGGLTWSGYFPGDSLRDAAPVFAELGDMLEGKRA